ncbi:MAG: hypothetical protein LBQ80_05755 [Clostridium sp.]|jgi:hypothetical protein|nr:hypothetical protein [Clostridium sp.]
MGEAFTQAFADFFSWASGWTFEHLYTILVEWLEVVLGWPFHWGTGEV